jgi:hypothetical protein
MTNVSGAAKTAAETGAKSAQQQRATAQSHAMDLVL